MSFASILQTIVDGCGGGIAAALMGNDGIPIEQAPATAAPEGAMAEDIGTAGVEFGRILEEIRKVSDSLAAGALSETMVSFGRFSLLFRTVDEDTFLVLAIAADANVGKARYLMRRHLIALRDEM
jgi:predicted regulator of Ras-like GTPase activity (Roadblock/LC7/MglB family)